MGDIGSFAYGRTDDQRASLPEVPRFPHTVACDAGFERYRVHSWLCAEERV
jgi:hypothetical protein